MSMHRIIGVPDVTLNPIIPVNETCTSNRLNESCSTVMIIGYFKHIFAILIFPFEVQRRTSRAHTHTHTPCVFDAAK